MKICIICHVFPPEHAPAGIMMQELTEDLSQLGHEVVILTGWPNHPRGILFNKWNSKLREVTNTPKGARLIRCMHSIHPRTRIHWRLWYYFTFALSTFFNGLREKRFDVVLCLSTPIFGSWSAWLLAKIKRAYFIYDIFDLHPEATRNADMLNENSMIYRFWRWQDTLLCKKSTTILTLSKALKQEIYHRHIEKEKIRVIPFWIDTERVYQENRLNNWRRQQGIPDDKFVALFAGTIGYVSGASILIETAKQLKKRKDILLLCVGEGVVKEEIQVKARALDLTNIRFLPFQPEKVLSEMQATADVGLITLLPETGQTSVPSKILGYLAAGRPVIASVAENSATAGMIRDGRCGIVVPPQDADELSKAIVRAADNRFEWGEWAENARKTAIERYSREICVTQYIKLMQECVGEEV